MIATRRIRIAFMCNDPRTGFFCGRALAADVSSLYCVGSAPWEADLVHDDWGRGCRLTVDDLRLKIRIHRVWFPFKAHRSWFGNWCWESFEFERSTGLRLMQTMRRHGVWQCEGGTSAICHWWGR